MGHHFHYRVGNRDISVPGAAFVIDDDERPRSTDHIFDLQIGDLDEMGCGVAVAFLEGGNQFGAVDYLAG